MAGPHEAEHLLWELTSFQWGKWGGNADPEGAWRVVGAGTPQRWSPPHTSVDLSPGQATLLGQEQG